MMRDYTVFNPNFLQDVIKFLGLEMSEEKTEKQIKVIDSKYSLTEEQNKAGELTINEKLRVFIDRIEFINHLELIKRNVIESEFIVLGQEVEGIHWDINALRLYLSLTCLDIFLMDGSHKKRFEDILINSSTEIKSKLLGNVKIVYKDNVSTDLKEISEFLYSIRNYYTHTGKRFHIVEDVPFVQIQEFLSGTMKNKEVKSLLINSGFNLIECILEIAIYDVKKIYEFIK